MVHNHGLSMMDTSLLINPSMTGICTPLLPRAGGGGVFGFVVVIGQQKINLDG